MAVEIERKFLVVGEPWLNEQGVPYRQGYLCTDPERTVRVRIAGDRGYLTIKGASVGSARSEFEYPISVGDAEQMLEILCDETQIEKIRYRIEHEGHTWEIDVFLGVNSGLVIAEVELDEVDETVNLPDWVGSEVTGDKKYYNASLSRHPYQTWPEK